MLYFGFLQKWFSLTGMPEQIMVNLCHIELMCHKKKTGMHQCISLEKLPMNLV